MVLGMVRRVVDRSRSMLEAAEVEVELVAVLI